MQPGDEEDEARIIRHREERRDWEFITLEQPRHIGELVNLCDPAGVVHLDSLTALLANEMFLASGEVREDAGEQVQRELTQLLHNFANIVIISDYIYSDTRLFPFLTENYRRSLAELDRLAARHCQVVLEVTAGYAYPHKGGELYRSFRSKME